MSPSDAFRELARTRDPQLRDRIVEEHLSLAEHLARRFAHRGEPLEDLVQVASLALVKAVDRFDPDHGVEFSSFAVPTIMGELKRHFRDTGWAMRVPRRLQELHVELGTLSGNLSQELGRSPTVAELAEATATSEDDVLEAMEAGSAYQSASLDAPPPSEDAGATLAATVGGPDAALADSERRAVLEPLLATLPERERTIIRLRFVEGLTQSEIGRRVGISQMHVSRLLNRSLADLRERSDTDLERP